MLVADTETSESRVRENRPHGSMRRLEETGQSDGPGAVAPTLPALPESQGGIHGAGERAWGHDAAMQRPSTGSRLGTRGTARSNWPGSGLKLDENCPWLSCVGHSELSLKTTTDVVLAGIRLCSPLDIVSLLKGAI
jgi:hypothetical protein